LTPQRALLFLTLIGLFFTPSSASSQMDVWPPPLEAVEVYRVPLWLPRFHCEADNLLSKSQTLEEIVYKDLEFSGLFDIVRKKPVSVGMDDTNFSVEVQGKISMADGEPVFEGWVTDVVSGDFIGGKRYKFDDKTLRRTAHHFADEVVRLVTGESGVAMTRITYTRVRAGQWELIVSDYDGYNPRVLVRQGVPLLNPRWVDNDKALVYTSYRAGKADLYIRYLAEAQSQTLADFAGTNITADWSDRHRRFLAALSKDGNSEIYILEKGGAVRKRLTHNRAIDTSPCWSPSGRELAFTSDRSGAPQLYVMETDGANVRRLTYTGGYNASAAWSPRGDMIAFVNRVGSIFQIATITPDGRDGRLLTTDSNSHEDPRWAPDGRHIVFTEKNGDAYNISVVDIRTRGKRILAEGASPDWSTH
jgi:TolB protein